MRNSPGYPKLENSFRAHYRRRRRRLKAMRYLALFSAIAALLFVMAMTISNARHRSHGTTASTQEAVR